jgi:tRNA pseudouridine55 synthase
LEAEANAPQGVLVVDKPAGPTSHDIIDRVRAALGTRRAGHTGTLDPFATGVLAVCLGKATRLVRFLAEGQKVYRATVRLGFATTTDDLLGEALGAPRPVQYSPAALAAALRGLTGALDQVPPSYSAKRVGGRRLYERAREGESVPRTVTRVSVHSLEVLAEQGDSLELEVRCSPGTYVRALARDLGQALGLGGHLTALRRLRSGAFGLEQAVKGDELSGSARENVLPLSALLTELPEVRVGAEGRAAVGHGCDLNRRLVLSGFPESPPARLRILDEAGELLALAVPRGFGLEGSALPVEPVLHPDLVLLS